MKHVLATLVALLAFQQAHAQYQARDLDFAAPIVYGDPLNTNSKIGSITYDLNTNTFRGLFADGNWNTLPGSFQAPTVQKFTSGSGTYTTPTNAKYIKVEMIGGGMGGSGSATRAAADNGAGGSGGNTTFGTSLLTAGGSIANSATSGNPGGIPVVNSPALDIGSTKGWPGSPSQQDATLSSSGGSGGGPGGGQGNIGGASSTSGTVNTGGGGGGAGSPINGISGSGGGSGAIVRALINSPSSTYSYTVGTGGTAGAAPSGTVGSVGGSGLIIVTEYYQ